MMVWGGDDDCVDPGDDGDDDVRFMTKKFCCLFICDYMLSFFVLSL